QSVYKVTEIVGTSSESWEDAVRNAIATASKTLRNLRVAEVGALDVAVDGGNVRAFRAKVKLSFKYEEGEEGGEDEEAAEAPRGRAAARAGGRRAAAASGSARGSSKRTAKKATRR